MKRIEEAWQILSDPAVRSRYVRAREFPKEADLQQVVATDITAAVRTAEDYPRSWQELELGARYGSTSYFGLPFPTVTDSVSGVLFIGGGAVVCGGLAAPLLTRLLPGLGSGGYAPNGTLIRLLAIPVAVGGAWVGRWAHSRVRWRHTTDKQQDDRSPSSAYRNLFEVVRCPECLAPLRIPCSVREVAAKCPKCRHRFAYGGVLKREADASTRVIRVLLSLYVIMFVGGAVIPWRELLPPDLHAWRTAKEQLLGPTPDNLAANLAGYCLVTIYLAATLTGVVGLFLRKRWGVWPLSAGIALYLAGVLAGAPYADSGAERLYDTLFLFLEGAIVSVALCTNACRE